MLFLKYASWLDTIWTLDLSIYNSVCRKITAFYDGTWCSLVENYHTRSWRQYV